ncbi:hypothetical protein [Micromonospora sp. DT233]|uniref:hypothetical protein n=1 Tax=Micromonospora sp. DT233 TaxID=3393432 RepID=UPI003CFAD022
MRLSRIIMALTVGLAVVAVPTAAGAAQPQPTPSQSQSGSPQPTPYPPQPPALSLDPPSICIGGTTTITGAGFGPNETVEITVTVAPLAAGPRDQAPTRRSDGSTVALAPVAYQAAAPLVFTAQANGAGRFSVAYTPSVVGRLTFTAVGLTSHLTASATISVLSCHSPQPTRSGLPVTGDSVGTPLALGGGLLGIGVVLTLAGLAWRRRRMESGSN